MKSIRDILEKFVLAIPPEKLLVNHVKAYLAEKKILNQALAASFHQGEVFLKCDPYLKLFIKTKEEDLLLYLKQKMPKYQINKIK